MLICRCADAGVVPVALRHALLAELGRRGVAFTVVDDLCGLAARRDPALLALAASSRPLLVAACHARAVRALFDAAGALPADVAALRVLDLRTTDWPAILPQLPGVAPATPAAAAPAVAPASAAPRAAQAAETWTPWFPVIDTARCRQCRQCLSFCLFGVYAQAPDGRVTVANPQACKNRCPACARICPEAAIIFPKLPEAEAPLNGAAIDNEQLLKDRAQANVQALLGDDLYAGLAKRRQTARNRRLAQTPQARAALERAACAARHSAPSTPSTTPQPPG